MKEFIIEKNDAGQRLDKFISKAVPTLPPSLMYKYIRLKRIKINGRRADIKTMLQLGDIISFYINDEFFEVSSNEDFKRITPKISVAYEDDNIIIVDKAAGMICHSDDTEQFNTLINHILAYLYRKGEYDPAKELSFTPALCNRIDRNTKGLVIAAKNAESHRILSEKIREREIKKYYLCILSAIPEKKSGRIENYLCKNEVQNRVYVHQSAVPGSKQAITSYNVLKTKDGLALAEVELITGRTHQIRAHFAHIGCPLLGDGKYGKNETNKQYGLQKQQLQSYKIVFDFKTDAGILNYLRGRQITCSEPLTLE